VTEIRNLVVYMSDGVRWDHHPDSVRELGTTFRTVAASLHTPTAIASMLTGQYLPAHGIRGFTDTLGPDQETVLDWFPNAGLSESPGNFNEIVYDNLLSRYDRVSLSAVEEPFGWFMRDAGGHAPYDGFDERLQTDETVRSYLEKHAGDEERMRRDYADGVDSSVDRFERFVLDPLEARGIREETLVVFASDHGQMLGEHGHVGESYPACPEIVYVPTTLIHPSLPVTEREELFRHVDLAPTIAGLLDADPASETAGVDVLAGESPAYGLNFYDRPYPSFLGEFSYTIDSVWDADGGHAFVRSSPWDKLKLIVGFLLRIPAGKQVRRTRSLTALQYLLASGYSWGEPEFSRDEAEELLAAAGTDHEPGTLEMETATRENLEDLGYL
jgi:hypothetical protein